MVGAPPAGFGPLLADDCGGAPAAAAIANEIRPSRMVGSGKFGTPCVRMHSAYCSAWASSFRSRDGGTCTAPGGSSFRQLGAADLICGLFMRAWVTVKVPWLVGSGKPSAPCERMHLENASAFRYCVDPAAPGGLPPPQAATSMAVAARAARARARRGPPRQGRFRRLRVWAFISV